MVLKINNKVVIDLDLWQKFPANIRLEEDVLKTSFVLILGRRLEDVFCPHPSALLIRLQKMSSRRLDEDKYTRLGHTSSRRLQDLFETSSRRLAKTSSKRL